jgi:hypothetical protein
MAPCTPYQTELPSRKYQVMIFKSAGSYAPHTPSPLRGSVLRFGGGLRLAADSAERSATRACACAPKSWRARGKLSPAQFGVIRGSMNATWYKVGHHLHAVVIG